MKTASLLLAALFATTAATTIAAPSAPAADTGTRTPTWVFFTDKGLATPAAERAAVEEARAALTPQALERRAKVRAADDLVDVLDVRVNPAYVDAVLATGATERATSRWLNAVSVECNPEQLTIIEALPFVASTRPVARWRRDEMPAPEKVLTRSEAARAAAPPRPAPGAPAAGSLDYGDCYSQIHPIQVDLLHDAGYSGEHIRIAVLDTGFERTHETFAGLQVLAEHDFINDDDITSNEPGDDPYQDHHGTSVLSILAGWSPGTLIGPAYGAQFILAKTEDITSETPVEEDYWTEAAEWADSLGADVLSSSLSYTDWYTYEDMDGDTAVSTIAADMAVANGIAVLTSAGNQGSGSWYYIGAPADADSGLAIGAVDSLGGIASFSSHGPTYDGRTKPDICAMGVATLVALAGTESDYGRGDGTSFSCPLAAGTAALVLSAHANWPPWLLADALRSTATRSASPDYSYGWGIVQGWDAAQFLSDVTEGDLPGVSGPIDPPAPGLRLAVSPNPSSGPTLLRFTLPGAGRALWFGPGTGSPAPAGAADEAVLTIHDVRGRRVRLLWRGSALAAGADEDVEISWDGRDDGGTAVAPGLYFARLETNAGAVSRRIVRVP